MTGNALDVLLRIRRASLDDAQRALADALRLQQRMQLQSEAEEARYAKETVAALDLAAGDEAVDAFARWLPIGRKAIEMARAAEQEASGRVDNTRVVLGLARAASRAVETLVANRNEEANLIRERKAQREMDETASRSRLT